MAFPAGAALLPPIPCYIQADKMQFVKLTTIDLIGGIKCHVCQLIFGNKKEFDSHYTIHNSGNDNTNEMPIVYTCVVCYREIPNYPVFRNHCYSHVVKEKFKCETCSKMFSKLSVLQNHIDAVHKFSCTSCKKEFPSKKELRIHQITHKNDDSPPYTCQTCAEQIEDIDNCEHHIEEHCTFTYSCPICNEDISSPLAAAEHLNKHFDIKLDHIPETGPTDIPEDSSLDLTGGIFCCHCDNVYKNRTEFDTHFIEQHSGKPIVYSCNICGKQYEKYLLFGDHCYYHTSKGRFECDECDKTFPRLSLLVLHTEAFHSADAGTTGPFPCGHCAHVFGTESRLRKHIRDRHSSQPLACPAPHCNYMFESPKDLIYHQRVHKTGNRCYHCGLQFTSAAACERHIHVHRKKLYSCPVCNRSYAEKYLVMKHVPQHFSSVLHLCKVCGKVFNARNRLVQHIKSHSKIRDHICSYCGKGFVKAYHLEQHLNIHTGLKPYKCSMCPKTFASYPNFSKHMRRMHSVSNPKNVIKTTDEGTLNEKAATVTPNETKQDITNETMIVNNNVVKSDPYVDSKSAEDYLFVFEESDDSAIETDSSLAALQQHSDLYDANVSADDLPHYMGPLPDSNLTFVSVAEPPAAGLPREYGPDLVNVIDLDDHMLPHIDPLLTIQRPGAGPGDQAPHAPWAPVITKVYQEFGEIPDGGLCALDTHIY